MKKRIAAVACALMMTFSMAVNVMAAPSPTGNRDTSASRGAHQMRRKQEKAI